VHVRDAEKLEIFRSVTGNRSFWKPKYGSLRVSTCAKSSERAVSHPHPRVGREEWRTTRSLRLAEFA
jgi:hypothetical protein